MADTVLATRPPSAPTRAWGAVKGLRRRHLALGVSIFLLLLVAGTGLLANWIAPHDPRKGSLADRGCRRRGLAKGLRLKRWWSSRSRA